MGSARGVVGVARSTLLSSYLRPGIAARLTPVSPGRTIGGLRELRENESAIRLLSRPASRGRSRVGRPKGEELGDEFAQVENLDAVANGRRSEERRVGEEC